MSLSQRRFLVYAIRLDAVVLKSKKFRERNPGYLPGLDCYYIGKTACTREERFRQHRAGYKANRFARDHGIELMPERFCHVRPKTNEEAERFERRLAKRLRGRGHGVWQA